MFFTLYGNKNNQILLTCLDRHRLADFGVTSICDGVHSVMVGLTTGHIGEVTCIIQCNTLSHFASVVHSRSHIVEGVDGLLPAKFHYIAGTFVTGLSISWSTGDWRWWRDRN